MCETGGRRRGGENNSCVCQLIMSAGGVKTAGEGEQNAPFMQGGRVGGVCCRVSVILDENLTWS